MRKRILCLVLAVCTILLSVPVFVGAANTGPQKLVGKRDFKWPVPGYYNLQSCYYDQRDHYALDFYAPKNADVVASFAGTVIKAVYGGADYYGDGFGNYVVLQHSYTLLNGNTVTLYSRYSHMNSVSVTEGQTVSAGRNLGKIGTSGNTTGPHLDFQILYGGWSPYKTYSIDPYSNYLLELPSNLLASGENSQFGSGDFNHFSVG